MKELLTREGIAFIVSRVLDNANDAVEESKLRPNDEFLSGKKLAYYEMLDTIKNELEIKQADLDEFKLDFILESLL